MGGLLDHALAYAAAGHRVFPIWGLRQNGTCECPRGGECTSPGKHPHGRLVPHGLKDATATADTLRAWWRQAPTANVGLCTGEQFWVLDVDLHGDNDGRAALAQLLSDHAAELPGTAHARTGGGGEHWFFRSDPDAPVRNQQALLVRDKRLAGLDVRGEGGYVVAAPSTHQSGGRYEWLRGLEALAPAPPWLQAIAAGHEIPVLHVQNRVAALIDAPVTVPAAPAATVPRAPGPVDVEQIAAALALIPPNEGRTEWVERVSMPLHDCFGGSEQGFQLWHAWCARGAGLATPNGNAAYGGIEECRKVWRSFSARHRNPKGMATFWQHARRHGWSPPAVANGHHAGAGPSPLPRPSGDDHELQPWRDPEPIWKPGTAPRLDIDRAFPPALWWLRDFVRAIAELQQVDTAFPTLLAMGLAAGAAGRLYELRLDGTGWREPMALWVICAMESGAGKSPIFRPLVRPFQEFEHRIATEEEQANADWEAELDIARTMVAHAQAQAKRRATKADESPIVREELRRIAVDARRRLAIVESQRPVSRTLLASSLTTPALVEFLMHHQDRCLIVDPEGGVFQHALAGRTDVEKDLDPWLKSFSCEPIKQNRVGDRRHGPIERHVRSPVLSMALSTQVGNLDLFRDRYADDRGFLARFLCATFDYALPEVALVRGEVPAELQAAWRERVHALMSRTVPREPHEILLTGTAGELFHDWMQRWLDEARRDVAADQASPVGYGTPVGAKLRSIALRLIMLLHVLSSEKPAEAVPDPELVRMVLDVWMPFLRASIARTLVVIRDDPARRLADRVLGYIWRTGTTAFSRTEVKQNLSDGKVTKVDDLNPALSALTDAGWIQPLDKPRFRGAHTVPAATRYAVHPAFRDHHRP